MSLSHYAFEGKFHYMLHKPDEILFLKYTNKDNTLCWENHMSHNKAFE